MALQTLKLRYSKKAGFAGIGVLLIFILLLLRTCITSYRSHDIIGAYIFGLFVLLLFFVMIVMVIYRLLPALKNDIALELDKNGIKDYVRNIIVDWKDVDDIVLKPGRSSAMLIFQLKFESDFGKFVAISLRWIEGRDRDIYDTVLAYFDEAEGIVREP
jgi:hypothetical protein